MEPTKDYLLYRLRVQELLIDICRALSVSVGSDLDRSIDTSLKRIGLFADADRCYVFLFQPNFVFKDNTHEWCRDGVTSHISRLQNIAIDDFWTNRNYIRQGLIFNCSNVQTLPEEAACDRQEFDQERIKAILLVPVFYQHKPIGFIGLDSLRSEKEWSNELVDLLIVAGEVLGGSIKRREALEELAKSKRRQSSYLHYVETLEKVSRALHGPFDLSHALQQAIEVVHRAFGSDRAWLLHPVLPDAEQIHIIAEATTPEYPGALESGGRVRLSESEIEYLNMALTEGNVITFGRGNEHAFPDDWVSVTDFGVRAMMCAIVRPTNDAPWGFGLHHCRCDRTWSKLETELFGEISHRLSDAVEQFVSQRKLTENRELLQAAIDGADLGTWDINYPNNTLVANKRFLEMLGYGPEYTVHTLTFWESLVHPEDWPALVENREVHINDDTVPFETEYRMRHKAGHWVWILNKGRIIERDSDGQPLRVVGTHLDISNRKEAEEGQQRLRTQLHQSQKLEAIGQLAGGVAHDFNNILTSIVGNVELGSLELEQRSSAGNGPLERLHQIGEDAQRGAALTRQLLAFSRRDISNPEVLDLGVVLRSVRSLLTRLITEDTILEIDFDPDEAFVEIDRGQLEQVLVNLVVNACDAIADGGTIRLTGGLTFLDNSFATTHLQSSAGEYALLKISDTGCGIQEDCLERIFEPFFTTKEAGKGTGLGLSTVYGIVKSARGCITVDSTPGRGTRFCLYFPVADAKAKESEDMLDSQDAPTGSEVILLCEDDASVRKMTGIMLRQAGYQVHEAARPSEALQLAKNRQGEISLLVTDVIMPEMNGRVLSQECTDICPGLRTLYISGYTANILEPHGLRYESSDLLSKPFSRHDMLNRVRRALDQSS